MLKKLWQIVGNLTNQRIRENLETYNDLNAVCWNSWQSAYAVCLVLSHPTERTYIAFVHTYLLAGLKSGKGSITFMRTAKSREFHYAGHIVQMGQSCDKTPVLLSVSNLSCLSMSHLFFSHLTAVWLFHRCFSFWFQFHLPFWAINGQIIQIHFFPNPPVISWLLLYLCKVGDKYHFLLCMIQFLQ